MKITGARKRHTFLSTLLTALCCYMTRYEISSSGRSKFPVLKATLTLRPKTPSMRVAHYLGFN